MTSPNWHFPRPVNSVSPLALATAIFKRGATACRSLGGATAQADFKKTTGAFTLVELLVVMALISILSTLTMMSLSSMGKSSALSVAGNRLSTLVNQARQNSMSKNVMTALVLVTGHAGSPAANPDYRALALLEYNAADSNPAWKQVSQWENLPTGIVVDTSTTDCTFLSNSGTSLPYLTAGVLPSPYQGASIGTYASRVFMPSGGLYQSGTSSKIQLVEGLVQGSSVIHTHPGVGGIAANYYRIAIIGATGRTKIERP